MSYEVLEVIVVGISIAGFVYFTKNKKKFMEEIERKRLEKEEKSGKSSGR